MKITIDTDNKTLEVISEISLKELNKFVEEFKLQDYKLVKSYTQNLIQQPYANPLVNYCSTTNTKELCQ
jgi:uncharacterized protein (DUF4213/DUF364 family)